MRALREGEEDDAEAVIVYLTASSTLKNVSKLVKREGYKLDAKTFVYYSRSI
jgi:hypothetical protein